LLDARGIRDERVEGLVDDAERGEEAALRELRPMFSNVLLAMAA
jgi:hypothetical protein